MGSGIGVVVGNAVGVSVGVGITVEVGMGIAVGAGVGTAVAVGLAANVACSIASTVASRFSVREGVCVSSAAGTGAGGAEVPQASANKAISGRRATITTLNICILTLLHNEIGVGSHGMGYEGHCTQGFT